MKKSPMILEKSRLATDAFCRSEIPPNAASRFS
jgi:hypothetical protein